MLSLYDIKQILHPQQFNDPADDFRVLDSWAEYDETSSKSPEERNLNYLCYELEVMNPGTGERRHVYKALKLARVIRLPADAKQSTVFMDMQEQVLAGVHEGGYNFITVIANVIKPVSLGLLYLYGVQGVADTLSQAKEQAEHDFRGFIGMMQGTFRVLEMRNAEAQESEWLREKMYNMDYLTVVRGIPKANKAGEDAGNKGVGGQNLNPDSQGTLEEIITGMADYEYVIEVLSTPVYLDTLEGWQRKSQSMMTEWYSQLQGTKSLSMNISIPMMYMANASQSQGWSKAYTNADTVSYARGESFTTSQGQSVGESLSQSFGKTVGQTSGTTLTNSVSQGVTHSRGVSFGESFGQNVSTSVGQNVSHSVGQNVSSSLGQNMSHSLGSSTSKGLSNSLSNSISHSTNQNQTLGESSGMSAGVSQGTSQGYSLNRGISQNQTYSQTTGLSQGQTTTQSHTVGNSQTFGRSANFSQSRGTSDNYGVTSGASSGYSSNWGRSSGSSLTLSQGTNGSHSDSKNSNNSINGSVNVGSDLFGVHAGGGGSHGWGTGHSDSQGWSSGASMGSTRGASYGGGSNYSTSNSLSHTSGVTNGVSYGQGVSSSVGQTNSYGLSLGNSTTLSNSVSHGTSVGQTESAGINYGVNSSQNLSRNFSNSASVGYGTSDGTGQSAGVSANIGSGTSEGLSLGGSTGYSAGASTGTSYGTSIGQSYGQSYSQNQSVSESVAESKTLGQSYGQSLSNSVSNSASQSYGQNVSNSQSVSNGNSYTTSNGTSAGTSNGTTGTSTLGTSSSMGLGPSIGYNKSYQWLDQGVKDLLELLEYQNERIKKALRGQGAFYTYVYIACPTIDALATAQAVAKATWQNEFAMVNPLQVLDLTESEQRHLLYHFAAFSADISKEDVSGVQQYKYCTVLLPEEHVAYTHLPRISEGGVFSTVQDIPKFSVPSMMKGEIYMGTILNPERFTFNNGYKTQFDYRIDESQLMHGFFTGASRSGKTVAAMRFIAELAHVKRKKTGKRLRIVVMDPKQDWRGLARFVEPERFNFYSMGNPNFRPIKINPWKIPHGVWPQIWIDGIIDIYCRAYGLLERGKQMIAQIVYQLYDEAGVFAACDKPDWKNTVSELSGNVCFRDIYKRFVEEQNALSGAGKSGNDTKDAYARLVERLSCFGREYSIENKLYGTKEGMAIDELIGGDDVTVLESKGLENTFKNFIFGAVTSGFYKYALANEGGFLADDQYETVLVIEEANEVLIGNDTAGSGGGSDMHLSGESEFEQIIDQSAGYGLFIIAITQKIADMPSSILANSGLVFAGRLERPDDVTAVVRAVGREERIDDRDLVKWFPRSPIGWFVCKTSRNFDFKNSEPVLVKIAQLNINTPSNSELDEMLLMKEAEKEMHAYKGR